MKTISIDYIRSRMAEYNGEIKYKENSVVILLQERPEGLSILFEKRSEHVSQPGDISFPGGRVDEGEDFYNAAIREVEEELGVDCEIIGSTGQYLSFWGMITEVFVGLLEADIAFDLDEQEVAEIFFVPVEELLAMEPEVFNFSIASNRCSDFPYHYIEGGENYPFRNKEIAEYFYPLEEHVIWGLTADFLYDFLEIIRQ